MINLQTGYAEASYKYGEMNKLVFSGYQESQILEKTDSTEHKYTNEENHLELPNGVVKIPKESENVEEESTKFSEEKQESIGTPIKAELTAYSDDPRDSEEWGSRTAMQTRTKLGVIAAPSNIPLGSKMYIPELKNYKADGVFSVEDRGGAIKIKKDGTYVIDVWVSSYKEAVNFGRKKTTIYLMK